MGKALMEAMIVVFLFLAAASMQTAFALDMSGRRSLDERVKNFLEKQKGRWADWNVPESDGEFLYHLIIKNNYRRALDIGTSTGHSAVWMAWALSLIHI